MTNIGPDVPRRLSQPPETPDEAVRMTRQAPRAPLRSSYLGQVQAMLREMGASPEMLARLAARRHSRTTAGSAGSDELDQ